MADAVRRRARVMVETRRAMAEPLSRLRAFLLLRYTLIAATAYLLLCEDRFAVPGVGVSLVVALALASNVVAAMLPARIVDSTLFAGGVIVGDTVWITAALLWSGHFSADFFYLYFFVLLLAAIGESLGLIAIGAVAVCAAYVYVLAVTGTGWSLWSSPSIIRVPFLFSAAAFYGYLVDRVRREERKVVAAQLSARARGEFLATVSHEIRTPMNGVVGWTELLLETPLTREQREYALGVRRSGQSLLAIINDILDFSRLEAGKLRLEAADFDPRALVEEVGDLFAGAAQCKHLELAYRVDADVPATVRGDAGRLRQILTNLVGNAIKFTDAGGVVLRVRVAEPAPDGVVLRLEVSDTGIGIAREQRAPFPGVLAGRQLDDAEVRRHGARAGDLAAARGRDGRGHRRRDPAGAGEHVLVHGPLRRRRRGAPAPGGADRARAGGRRQRDDARLPRRRAPRRRRRVRRRARRRGGAACLRAAAAAGRRTTSHSSTSIAVHEGGARRGSPLTGRSTAGRAAGACRLARAGWRRSPRTWRRC
jgi:signal transduction histidine kinase